MRWIFLLGGIWAGSWPALSNPLPESASGDRTPVVQESAAPETRDGAGWLEDLKREARAEVDRWERIRESKALRSSRLNHLERKGYASAWEVAEAAREARSAERESEAARAFRDLIERSGKLRAGKALEPAGKGTRPPHLRLPGITQRVSGVDYFTLELTGDQSLVSALAEAKPALARPGEGSVVGPGLLLVEEQVLAPPLTPETAILAGPVLRFRGAASGELRCRQAIWDEAKRRLLLVKIAVGKGVAAGAEQRAAQMAADLAESEWNAAEARVRLAQWEWARFRNLAGEMDAKAGEEVSLGTWETVSEVVAALEERFRRVAMEPLTIAELLRVGRDAARGVLRVERARERRDAALDLAGKVARLHGAREAEKERFRLAVEAAEAELQWAEEQRMEACLAFRHVAGLCEMKPAEEGQAWSMSNAAAWGKKLAAVEVEIAGYRKRQAEIRLRHEQTRLAALYPLQMSGAASAYELQKQKLICQMAEGGHWTASSNQDHVRLKLAFLEEIRGTAWQAASLGEAGISGAAWKLLASYASRQASSSPGRLRQLEAAIELSTMRMRELDRLGKAGLARPGEQQQSEIVSRTYIALAEAEKAKDQAGGALLDLVAAVSAAGIAKADPETRPGGRTVIEMAPLP